MSTRIGIIGVGAIGGIVGGMLTKAGTTSPSSTSGPIT